MGWGSGEKQEQFKVESGLTSRWFGYFGQIFNVLNLSHHFTDEKNVAHRNWKTPLVTWQFSYRIGTNLNFFFLFPTSPRHFHNTIPSQNVYQEVDPLRYSYSQRNLARNAKLKLN